MVKSKKSMVRKNRTKKSGKTMRGGVRTRRIVLPAGVQHQSRVNSNNNNNNNNGNGNRSRFSGLALASNFSASEARLAGSKADKAKKRKPSENEEFAGFD